MRVENSGICRIPVTAQAEKGIPQIRGLGIGHRLPGDFKAIAM